MFCFKPARFTSLTLILMSKKVNKCWNNVNIYLSICLSVRLSTAIL